MSDNNIKYKNVDVVIRTARGHLQYNADVAEELPLAMVGEAVMANQQLQPLLSELDLHTTTHLVVTSASQLRGKLPPGLTLVSGDVSFNEPLLSDVPRNLPLKVRIELDRLITNQAVVVTLEG